MGEYTHLKWLMFVIPFFAFFIIGEMLVARHKNKDIYLKQDSIANFCILLIRSSLNFTMAGGILYLILAGVAPYSLNLVSHLNKFWYWTTLMIGQDFFYYWFHRYSHECRFGWASHVVHHSSNYLNYLTAVRESVTYMISGVWIFWLPLVIIGYTPRDVLIATVIGLVYQFFLHTRLIGKLGAYEYIFNTPSHHRVHHARNPHYINKNYGGILIIWDRLFGSFVEEKEEPDYGLTHKIYNYNPFYILFHGWYDMFREVVRHRNLKYLLVFPNPQKYKETK